MSARVLVVGSLNMDLVVRCERHPAAGETVLGGSFARQPGGKGANQAVAAARLLGPGRVAFAGAVGDDAWGVEFERALRAEGIDTGGLRRLAGLPTGVGVVAVDASGENRIVVAPGANARLELGDLARHLAGVGWVLLQLEVPLAAVRAAQRAARAAGARVLLNAAPAADLPPECLAEVDVLVVNALEAEQLSGEREPGDAARALRARGAGAVAVTLGARGALWLDGRGALEVPAPTVEAVDSTGAGDAFCGALAAAFADGLSPAAALERACAAGALAVTRAGAMPSLPTAAELENRLSGRPEAGGCASWATPRP